jgi:hypothetical protein
MTAVTPRHSTKQKTEFSASRAIGASHKLRGTPKLRDGATSPTPLLAFPDRKESSRTRPFEIIVLITGLSLLAITALIALTSTPRGRAAVPRDLASLPAKAPVSRAGNGPGQPNSKLDTPVADVVGLEAVSTASISQAAPLLPLTASLEPQRLPQIPTDALATEPGEPSAQGDSKISAADLPGYLRRAETLLQNGDISGARSLFGRVALAGDSRGALGMAQTYDPEKLKKLGVYGLRANPAEADHWRARARELTDRERLPSVKSLK